MGKGINAIENEDFVKLEKDRSYQGLYITRNQSKKWSTLVELDGKYCEFELSRGLTLLSEAKVSQTQNIFQNIINWLINLFN